MDKSMVNQFTSYVEQLRNTECSQKEKIACFQRIAECIMSPALAAHINYATHINMATTVLLLFCEDLDPVVRMNAEENLNRIFRSLEKTRVSRILMDLYGEIKRNGNYRSLRICLNLFGYYAPQIRERNIKWYAVRLSPCLQTIAQRKETQLCETLCDFVKSFGKYLQMGLTDSESCKLFEAFMTNIGAECAVKRRCSAQNCISLIENSRNKNLMERHGLNKTFEFLLADQQQHNVLGVLGFLRLLLPLIIYGFHSDSDSTDDCDDGFSQQQQQHQQKHTTTINNKSKTTNSTSNRTDGAARANTQTQPQREAEAETEAAAQKQARAQATNTATATATTAHPMPINKECRQIIEIFDYCLHLLNISNATQQHAIINAALEVINAILQALDVANSKIKSNSYSNYSNYNDNKKSSDLVKSLHGALCNQQLQHSAYLRRRKSLKNQIFQLRNYEVSVPASAAVALESELMQSMPKGGAEVKEGDMKQTGNRQTKTTAWQKGSDTEENHATRSRVNIDDDEGEVILRRAPNIRYAGRSISECVIDDEYDIGAPADAANDDDAHRTTLSTNLAAVAHIDVAGSASASAATNIRRDGEFDAAGIVVHRHALVDLDDDDDFTTLSEINEPQQLRASTAITMVPPSYALTTTIDVDNLIDAIDTRPMSTAATEAPPPAAAGSNNSSRVVHTKIQGMKPQNQEHQQQEELEKQQQQQQQEKQQQQMHEGQVKPQNLLTAAGSVGIAGAVGGGGVGGSSGDDKSQHLSDIDNQSFNSIDFEAEITIAGMSGAVAGDASPKASTTTTSTTTTRKKAAEECASVFYSETTSTTATAAGGSNNKLSSSVSGSGSDTIGAFFNNLISNAASESMSKLFRPSSSAGARATPTKSVTTTPTTAGEKIDESASSNTSAPNSMTLTDNISLISMASSGNKMLDLSAASTALDAQSDSAHTRTQSIASSSVGMHDDTASTALLVDGSLHSAGGRDDDDTDGGGMQSEKIEMVERRIPNVNPFLSEKSPLRNTAPGQSLLTLKIGTLFEQSLIRYAARLIAARFLLTGQAATLHNDTQIRISIKSLSLTVLAHCVRFDPEVLQLPLEITERELSDSRKQSPNRNVAAAAELPSPSKSSSASGSASMPQSDESVSESSSNLGKDYEHLDAVDFVKNKTSAMTTAGAGGVVDELPAELQLLEIKDDHFGKSNFDYLFHTSSDLLTKSADPVLMSKQISDNTPTKFVSRQQQQQQPLSKSEIIASKSQHRKSVQYVTESAEDTPPQMLPPKPPKRTKSQRKSIAAATATVAALRQIDEHTTIERSVTAAASAQLPQQLSDVLLYYNHTDPMLRGGVQQIVGDFLRAVGGREMHVRLELNVQHLLAMLVKGLQDEIHTVVIQALNAFEKIFPYVVSKYLQLPKANHQYKHKLQQEQQQQQHHQVADTSRRSKSLAVDFTQEVDKDHARKRNANAAGQVPQQQQQQQQQQQNAHTNDCTNSGLNTHVSGKEPLAKDANNKCSSTNAKPYSRTRARTILNDNDELIDALLYDFQMQSKLQNNKINKSNYNSSSNTSAITQSQLEWSSVAAPAISSLETTFPVGEFRISPKLLLSKLRLCHYNKYWLVENKYAEVISNLNYAALHAACNDCHGYCCGTALGCECGIGGIVGVVDVAGNAGDVFGYGNAASNSSNPNADKNAANTSVNADRSALKEDATSADTLRKCAEMSYNKFDDNVCIYESHFLDALLHLIGDDDFRVREHAAHCLCRFIIKNAKRQQIQKQKQQPQIANKHNNNTCITTATTTATQPNKFDNKYPSAAGIYSDAGIAAFAATAGDDDIKSLSSATYETNFNLLWDFFDYRLFSGLPLPLRNLFRAMSSPPLLATSATGNTTATATTTTTTTLTSDLYDVVGDFGESLPQRCQAEEEKLLAKVLYRMTNKLMELNDKSAQFGIIYTLKLLLEDFNFIDYQRAWMEFNLIEICQKFSYHNYVTAVDLACQNDLMDVTGKLMAGYTLASTLTSDQHDRAVQLQLDQLLVHTMKLLNIYYHLITQQKPLLFAKVQKSDLFPNAKELALVQSVGYFGSEYVYIKLYNILKSANDSYKITINQESGSLLISLLRTCLNTLSLCIELRTQATPLLVGAGTPTGSHTPSHASQRLNSPGSSGSGSGGGGSGGGAGFVGGSSNSSNSSSGGRDNSPNAGAMPASSGGTSAVFPSNASLKLIEEILQYLSKLVNYAPGESIACLRQLLKYLFGQNYGNQQRDYYATFIRPYFVVRSKGQQLLQQQLKQQHQQQQQQQRRRPHKLVTQQVDNNHKETHTTEGGGDSAVGGDLQQTMTTPHVINSMTMTTTATATTTTTTQTALTAKTLAAGIARSAATIGSLASALQQRASATAAGNSSLSSSSTMTTATAAMSSNVIQQNEPNVIGKQATYATATAVATASSLRSSEMHIDFVGNATGISINSITAAEPNFNVTEYYRLMGELFASGLNLQTWKSERASECVKHIKLFEPLVIYCLMLFLKSNALIQAPILELLHQLLELNVTYSVLDSKNVIFDQILNNLDLIENGIVRNGPLIIPPMIKFLIQLTHKSDRKLITIPKIISITNGMLANNAVLDCAVIALKSLAYELFFMPLAGNTVTLTTTLADYRAPFQSPVTRSPVQQRRQPVEDVAAATAAAEALLANSRELETQKEVVLGMLEKFIAANELHHVVALLLLRERSAEHLDHRSAFAGFDSAAERQLSPSGGCNLESTLLQDPSIVYALICRAMCDGRLSVSNWRGFHIIETSFKNYGKYVLADSKNFLRLLELFLSEDVENFSTLAHATIILANVILKTEEIYLVNHIKLYLKNHPAAEERARNRNQQQLQQQQQQQRRGTAAANCLPPLDGPSTSLAAARAAATACSSASNSGGSASSGSISEINYFAKVLCEKLERCLENAATLPTTSAVTTATTTTTTMSSTATNAANVDVAYLQLVCRFIAALHEVCCRSRHKDALQSVFRLVLAESSLLDKYCHFIAFDQKLQSEAGGFFEAGDALVEEDSYNSTFTAERYATFGGDDCVAATQQQQLHLEVLKLLSAMKLLDPVVMLQLLQQQKQKVEIHEIKQQQQQQLLDYELQVVANSERVKWYANMQRTLLSEICWKKPNARDWTAQQVKQLLNAGGATAVNFLIVENFEFVSDLCEQQATATATTIETKNRDSSGQTCPSDGSGGELCSLWLNALLEHANALNKRSIRALPPLLLRLCCKATTSTAGTGYNLELTVLSLLLLQRLKSRCQYSRAMLLRLERLAHRLALNAYSSSSGAAVSTLADDEPLQRQQQRLLGQLEELVEEQLVGHEVVSGWRMAVESSSSSTEFWQQLSLDTQECKLDAQPLAVQQQQQQQQKQQVHLTIDEKWLLSQLIKFSAQPDYGAQQLSRILLEIQPEQKLLNIFNNNNFGMARVLRHAIASSMEAMLATFRHNCIQYNPHIHYMRPNPLVRVTCAMLMTRINAEIAAAQNNNNNNNSNNNSNDYCKADATKDLKDAPSAANNNKNKSLADAATSESGFYLCEAVTTLLACLRKVEDVALLYIESRFIDKFMREQFLRPENVTTLLHFLDWCCRQVRQQWQPEQLSYAHGQPQDSIRTLLQCIAALLQQRFIWIELNQIEKTNAAAGASQSVGAAQTAAGGALLTVQQGSLLLCRILDVLVLTARQTLQHTVFYRNYKQLLGDVDDVVRTQTAADAAADCPKDMETNKIFNTSSAAAAAAELESYSHLDLHEANVSDIAVGRLLQSYAPKAVFLAKLIEMRNTKSHISAAYLTGEVGGGGAKGGAFNNASGGVGSASGAGGGGNTAASGGAAGYVDGNDGLEDLSFGDGCGLITMDILVTIGIAVLRSNQFYAYAVTPYEIIQQQQHDQLRLEHNSPVKHSTTQTSTSAAAAVSCGKLPTIPVESLSDVDVLRKFVKRLSIFGFTTRQQFEEYFMTFLLLINKVYDENMVDEQEQFQIRSTCFEAILELLITYKTFPIVGNKLSYFHHTTRWTRINCDSISLKKLHKVQLLVSEANVFYHPNLERQLRKVNNATSNYDVHAATSLSCRCDTIIGTSQFEVNQYDLNFIWQQMEAYAQNTTTTSENSNTANDAEMSPGAGVGELGTDAERKANAAANEDTATKNYRYFTSQSGVDFKSSTQLIFDVLMQTIENNHILVLPNLVKFTEICESRDQIKWIKEKALKLQETIPMDDTISHQHLIYLLCKTQAMLIPTLGELQQLCQLIGNYLKSSHIFIRNATLAGLLCLLECCSKTNTTIGKLSEELALLRELIVGYINRHGIIDGSSMQCSDTHTKLVWTLNYCLIEWTSKFVPQCPLLSNAVIAAGNFLRKTNNEDVFLCVLHGLERIVVASNTSNTTATATTTNNAVVALTGTGIATPALRNKIEKLALELVKLENERFSIPALQLLLSCIYVGSAKQLENTELSNGIVQDEPEIIAQQTDKVDILLHCIKSSTRDAAWIYGQVLCQIIRDLVPPNEILTKVIKEFLAINQPHCDVIAMIVYQVFRCAIDSSFLQMLQDWLICSLPTFLALPQRKGVWCLSVIFLSASINLHLIKLFPVLLSTGAVAAAAAAGAGAAATAASSVSDAGDAGEGGKVWADGGEFYHKLGQHEIALFVTAAADFHAKLNGEQRMRFRDAFEKFQRQPVYAKLLQNL